MITLKHLQIFCEVAKTKSMSKAAENLYLSQPTVSQKVQEIEKYYNVTLFQRYSKTLGISEEGKLFLEHASKVLMEMENIENTFFHNKNDITLRIGTTLTIGATLTPIILNNMRQHYPYLQFRVYVDNTQVIETMLLENHLDIALVEGDIHSDNIISTPVIPDQMVLVCSSQNPLAHKAFISFDDLARHPFIVREKGSGTRTMLEQVLTSKKIPYHIAWECRSWESIKQAVMVNQGITLISARLVEREIREGLIKVLNIDNITWKRKFSLCYHKNKAWTDNLELFKEEVQHQIHCPILDLINKQHKQKQNNIQ